MKRTAELKRTPFKPRLPDATPKPAPGPRKRRCRAPGCSNRYTVIREQPFVCWCSHECAEVIAKDRIAKQRAKQQRQERVQDKIKREGMKTYPQLIRECQKAFNAFIRLRDQLAGYPCISSGRPLDWSGNAVDAGHYRSIGSAPHLRFNEDNVHAQAKYENRFMAGAAVDYRLGLIARRGLAVVEALEADNTPRKWTHDELRAIKAHYKQKLKELQNGLKI